MDEPRPPKTRHPAIRYALLGLGWLLIALTPVVGPLPGPGGIIVFAAGLTLPVNAFIDGAFRPANSGKTFKTTNPATGGLLAEIAACDASDVDFAVAKARQAFDDGRWRLKAPGERKEILLRLAKLLENNRHELAVMESIDSGKPVRPQRRHSRASASSKLRRLAMPVSESVASSCSITSFCAYCTRWPRCRALAAAKPSPLASTIHNRPK